MTVNSQMKPLSDYSKSHPRKWLLLKSDTKKLKEERAQRTVLRNVRNREILLLRAKGLTQKEIAEKLDIKISVFSSLKTTFLKHYLRRGKVPYSKKGKILHSLILSKYFFFLVHGCQCTSKSPCINKRKNA